MKVIQLLKLSVSTLLLVLSLSSDRICTAVVRTAGSTRQYTSTFLKTTDSSHDCCDGYEGRQDNFTHYVLAESYPPAICRSNSQFSCDYPSNVSSWTLHGLWPSIGPSTGPYCCNLSAGFDESTLQDLVPKLVQEWTNMKPDRGFYEFWKHEWLKHGTCAPTSMHPEHNYLSTTLSLYENGLNFGEMLKSAGIHPSNNYTVEKILSAFDDPDVVSQLICKKINNQNTLIEVRICLDINFQQTKCLWKSKIQSSWNCRSKEGNMVYYASQPQRP